MPLEISEIGVHVAVGQGAGPSGASVPHTPPGLSGGGQQGLTPAQHEEIVNACVAQVLKNLRQMQER
jgi:hypothetical protein